MNDNEGIYNKEILKLKRKDNDDEQTLTKPNDHSVPTGGCIN